jgi:hypothetical protein
MAELALLVSIARLTRLAGTVIVHCIQYAGAVRDRHAEIMHVKNNLASFNAELTTLQSAVERYPDLAADLSHLSREDGAVTKATAAMTELIALLGINALEILDSSPQPNLVSGPGSSQHTKAMAGQPVTPQKRRKFMTAASSLVRSLRWPLDEEQMRKIIADLQGYQAAISLALQVRITYVAYICYYV